MKTTTSLAIVLACLAAATAPAAARPHPTGFGGKKFEANKKFGLGLELGEPTGLTGKVFVASDQAIQFGLGTVYHDYYGGDGFHIYGDYLWHPVVLTEQPAFDLPFYVGVGARLFNFNYACGPGNNNTCNGADAFGIRVPVGIAFDFNNVPLDIFIQIVPTLDFFHDYGPHDVYLDIDFSVGIRYWFS